MVEQKLVLSDVGERELISILRGIAAKSGVDSPGVHPADDACVIPFGDTLLVLSTDTIWDKTHIPEDARPEDAGHYLAAVNLSDLAAMGAEPVGALLSLSVPRDTSVEWLKAFTEGFTNCLAENGAKLLGGDTKEGPGVFSATVLGTCTKGKTLPRSGARLGDLLAVTGTIGRSALRHKEGKGGAMLRVYPRLNEGLIAVKEGVHAAIDISDGLALSLHYMAEASGMLLEVVPEDIPGPWTGAEDDLIFFSGGDFELLLAFPPKSKKMLEIRYGELGTPLTVIGRVAEGMGVVKEVGNSFIPVDKKGYEHFRG